MSLEPSQSNEPHIVILDGEPQRRRRIMAALLALALAMLLIWFMAFVIFDHGDVEADEPVTDPAQSRSLCRPWSSSEMIEPLLAPCVRP